MNGSGTPSSDAWAPLLDPPYAVDLLADLHAGVLDPEFAAQLWPRARADPDAAAVLSALQATQDQLRTLGEHPVAVDIPPAVAARLDAALIPPAGAHLPLDELAAARARRRRRTGYLGAGLVAAAVTAVFAFAPLGGDATVPGHPQAAPAAPVVNLDPGTLGTQALAAVGKRDFGPLSDATTLRGCLQANGVSASTVPVGGSEVRWGGNPAILLLLPTGRAAVFTALVVGPECAAGSPATLRRTEIGAR